MERINEYLERPWVKPVLYLLVGILVGWFVFGWGLFPVEWTDATPAYLREDLKVDYLRMSIDSYGVNGDASLAKQRWLNLGDDAVALFQKVQDDPRGAKLSALTGFAKVVDTGVTQSISSEAKDAEPESNANDATVVKEETTTNAEAETVFGAMPTQAPKKNPMMPVALGAFCVLSVVLVFAVGYIFLKRGGKLGRKPARAEAIPSQPYVPENVADKGAEYFRPANEAPVSQFMTTYMAGDEQYDDSFSIDNPIGEFLGECGVGITETIGVGEPKKTAAFEVWLFDKNDIQTVTKVLMSEHTFNDPSLQQKLLSKGEPILAEPGKRILLETASLQLEARIVDMSYGQGPLPQNSYFERLTLELAVWTK